MIAAVAGIPTLEQRLGVAKHLVTLVYASTFADDALHVELDDAMQHALETALGELYWIVHNAPPSALRAPVPTDDQRQEASR